MKKPHGTPSKACPMTRTGSDSAYYHAISRRYTNWEHDESTYKEGNKDSGIHEDQGQDGCPAVPKAVGNRPSQKDSHKSTALASLEERALPFGRNGVRPIGLQFAISLLEGSQSDKITIQEHVEGLHNLSRRR